MTDDTELVFKVNQVLRQGGVRHSVSSLFRCTSDVFLALYEIVTGSENACESSASELEKCEFIVDSLEAFLGVDLCHIEGSALACGQVEAIRDLLSVIVELWTSRRDGEWKN